MASQTFFVIFSIFVSVQCQIFAPYPRSPVVMPGCSCGSPAPVPVMKLPCQMPAPAAAPVQLAKAPLVCAEPPVTRVGPIAELPVGLPLANPFLPVASPVSAMAPYSPYLPPANSCSRCQFLKKIPIPPPCI